MLMQSATLELLNDRAPHYALNLHGEMPSLGIIAIPMDLSRIMLAAQMGLALSSGLNFLEVPTLQQRVGVISHAPPLASLSKLHAAFPAGSAQFELFDCSRKTDFLAKGYENHIDTLTKNCFENGFQIVVLSLSNIQVSFPWEALKELAYAYRGMVVCTVPCRYTSYGEAEYREALSCSAILDSFAPEIADWIFIATPTSHGQIMQATKSVVTSHKDHFQYIAYKWIKKHEGAYSGLHFAYRDQGPLYLTAELRKRAI